MQLQCVSFFKASISFLLFAALREVDEMGGGRETEMGVLTQDNLGFRDGIW